MRELQASISAAELTEWMSFAAIEPFGDGRADDRARLLAAVAFNASRGPAQAPMMPADFLRVWEDPEAAEAAKFAALQAWAAQAVPAGAAD